MSAQREAFFTRVRASLDAGREQGSVPQVDEVLVRLCGPGEDLVARFTAGATALGMVVRRLRAADLELAFAELCQELLITRVTVSPDEGPLRAALPPVVTIVEWRCAVGLEAHYDVDAGITDARAAIAETGSIVLHADAARSRGAFLVPPIHVCVLRAAQIVPDLLDLLTPGLRDLPTSLVIVSGPSKTADIEGILITGVHGPRAVHVLLLEDA